MTKRKQAAEAAPVPQLDVANPEASPEEVVAEMVDKLDRIIHILNSGIASDVARLRESWGAAGSNNKKRKRDSAHSMQLRSVAPEEPAAEESATLCKESRGKGAASKAKGRVGSRGRASKHAA